MSTERGLGRSIRVAALGVLAACTSGCVGLQTSGPITPVTQADLGNSRIRTWPSPPSPGEPPGAIVSAFLQSADSGSANLPITKAYLTGSALQEWEDDQNKVIVLADDSETPVTSTTPLTDQTDTAEMISGDLVGTLDENQQYQAQPNTGLKKYNFQLTKTKQGYRISDLPDDFGVVIQQSDFESGYAQQDIYFANAALNNGKLIPTQVYLPASDTDQDTANELAGLLLHGVPGRLGKAATSGVGPAQLEGSVKFQPDDTIQVTLKGKPCSQPHADCDLFASQLAATFSSALSSTKVSTVRVTDAGDSVSGQASGGADAFAKSYDYGVGGRTENAPNVYMVSTQGQVERLNLTPNSSGGTSAPTVVPIGSGKTKFGSVAVQPGQTRLNLALTSQDGKSLYLVNQVPFPGDPHAVFTGDQISSLSWDESGHLWFTAKTDGVTNVYRYSDGNYAQVQIEGLGGDVASVAAAPDSDRVAVAYVTPGFGESIVIGAARAQPDGSWSLDLSDSDSETVVAMWYGVSDFGWYNEDSLSVLGTPATAASLRLYRLYADGSPVYDPLTQQQVEPTPVTDTVAMCWNADGQPIALTKDGKLYELSVEGQDAQSLTDGPVSSPSY